MLTLEQVFFFVAPLHNVWSGIGVKIKVSIYYAVLLFYVVEFTHLLMQQLHCLLLISHLKTETFHFIVHVCHFMKVSFCDGPILWRSHFMMVLFLKGPIYEGLIIWCSYSIMVSWSLGSLSIMDGVQNLIICVKMALDCSRLRDSRVCWIEKVQTRK